MEKENLCPMILFFLTRTTHIHSVLILRILQLFFSLPANTEDTIALYLYNHVIDRTPQLRRIEIIFNYEEDLDERASIGHSRKSEYAVRGKKLVKLKTRYGVKSSANKETYTYSKSSMLKNSFYMA